MNTKTIADLIDHTLLKQNTTHFEIIQLCDEAINNNFASVCIPPYYVREASNALESQKGNVKVSTVVGFPLGYSSVLAKVEEIKRAIHEGADEIDAVLNICAIKNEDWGFVRNEIDSLVLGTHMKGKVIKLILETAQLTNAEIEKICTIALDFKPNFLKTSSGFNGGASLEAVQTMLSVVGNNINIKASGGIRDLATLLQYKDLGVKRIGTSAGVSIMEEVSRFS
jgi:deoxyribose-phosphate aldolase